MDNLNQTVVEVENVSFTYGCHPVFNNISLTVKQGESVGLTGPNGAGKTTLLKLITGQLRPQKGKISLLGHMAGCRKTRSFFSYLSQRATHFNPSFPASVREVVLSGLTASKGLFRLYSRTDRKRVEECLKMVGLKDKAREPIWSLSGGQQQRIFMARALMNRPQLVILDEPTVGLDIVSKEDLKNLLSELNQKNGVTFLIVSHEQDWLNQVINRKICLHKHLCSCCDQNNFSRNGLGCFGN